MPNGSRSVKVGLNAAELFRLLSMVKVSLLRPPKRTTAGEKLLERTRAPGIDDELRLGATAVAGGGSQVPARVQIVAGRVGDHVDADGAGAIPAEASVREADGGASVRC